MNKKYPDKSLLSKLRKKARKPNKAFIKKALRVPKKAVKAKIPELVFGHGGVVLSVSKGKLVIGSCAAEGCRENIGPKRLKNEKDVVVLKFENEESLNILIRSLGMIKASLQ